MKGAGDANASEWLAFGVLFADCHQPWHLLLCNFDLLASELGKGDVFNFVLRRRFLCFGLFRFWFERCGGHGWVSPIGVSLSLRDDGVHGHGPCAPTGRRLVFPDGRSGRS